MMGDAFEAHLRLPKAKHRKLMDLGVLGIISLFIWELTKTLVMFWKVDLVSARNSTQPIWFQFGRLLTALLR